MFRTAIKWVHALCWPAPHKIRLALQANHHPALANDVRFDSDSFAVGVDNHASRCMGNNKRLFDNLILARTLHRIGGINKGLAIQGKGTLVINIDDDNGKPHRIKIPNSLYLPGLKMCLLSPQHWAQEARDNYPLPAREWKTTHTVASSCGVKVYSPRQFLSAMRPKCPSFIRRRQRPRIGPSCTPSRTLEAPFFSREHVHQLPGRRWLDRGSPPDPAELVAEENFGFSSMPLSEGDEANKRSRSPLETVQDGSPLSAVVRNDLRYNPSPPLTKEDEYCVAALDDQAELMRWLYRLGHELFARLKSLAENG